MSGKKQPTKRRRSKLFITSTQFRRKPGQFIKRVKSHGIAVMTSRGRPPLVCLSVDDFNALESGQASAELLAKCQVTWQRMAEKKLIPRPIRTKVLFENLEQLNFPAYVTVHLEHFATGEGTTRGIHMLFARSAEELRKTLIRDWGEFYCRDCEIKIGLVLDPAYEDLVPEGVRETLSDVDADGHLQVNFIFSAKLYVNRA